MPSRHHVMMEVGPRPILPLYINADTANYDLFVAAGSPGGVVSISLTVSAGVTVSSATPGTTALYQTSAFAAGSLVNVIILGTVCGCGGVAGDGQSVSFPANGGVGHDGGDAIAILNNWTIDNTYGNIFGGGGGGAGGRSYLTNLFEALGGGGGGGGQGVANGVRGVSGAGGANGTNGTFSSKGFGGAGASNARGSAQDGGNGGGWGLDGQGTTGVNGGNAGNAIVLNGHVVTWIGGNNPTQVRGVVS